MGISATCMQKPKRLKILYKWYKNKKKRKKEKKTLLFYFSVFYLRSVGKDLHLRYLWESQKIFKLITAKTTKCLYPLFKVKCWRSGQQYRLKLIPRITLKVHGESFSQSFKLSLVDLIRLSENFNAIGKVMLTLSRVWPGIMVTRSNTGTSQMPLSALIIH